jgi:hypothetical protein
VHVIGLRVGAARRSRDEISSGGGSTHASVGRAAATGRRSLRGERAAAGAIYAFHVDRREAGRSVPIRLGASVGPDEARNTKHETRGASV